MYSNGSYVLHFYHYVRIVSHRKWIVNRPCDHDNEQILHQCVYLPVVCTENRNITPFPKHAHRTKHKQYNPKPKQIYRKLHQILFTEHRVTSNIVTSSKRLNEKRKTKKNNEKLVVSNTHFCPTLSKRAVTFSSRLQFNRIILILFTRFGRVCRASFFFFIVFFFFFFKFLLLLLLLRWICARM